MHGTKHAWVTACRCIEERRHGGGRPAEIAVGTWMAHPTVIGHGNVLPKKNRQQSAPSTHGHHVEDIGTALLIVRAVSRVGGTKRE